MTKGERLQALRRKCLSCQRCSIGGKKINGSCGNVFSNMCLRAKIMVIGQNPGAVEVKLGEPFVGPSGKHFDAVVQRILAVGREEFYITNTVHCHTPFNRSPVLEEIKNCADYLDEEIDIMQPRLIVTLGVFAFKRIMGMNGLTGKQGALMFSVSLHCPVLPLYHPSPLNMADPERADGFEAGVAQIRQFIDYG